MIYLLKKGGSREIVHGIRYQIVPWTWARLIKQEDAPAKIVEVNVVNVVD